MSLKDFQLLSKLGEGAYSYVYKVKRLEDSQEYALKKVKLQNLNDKEKQNAMNEVRILASVKHPNIISYKEAFIDIQSNSLWQKLQNFAVSIVMELADGSDLYCHQKKRCIFKIQKYFLYNSQHIEYNKYNQICCQFKQILQNISQINSVCLQLKIKHQIIFNKL